MKTIRHMCIDVQGCIMGISSSRKKYSMFDDKNGKPILRETAIRSLLDELGKGRKVIPMGEPCEGFSYETGCPGHEVKE